MSSGIVRVAGNTLYLVTSIPGNLLILLVSV